MAFAPKPSRAVSSTLRRRIRRLIVPGLVLALSGSLLGNVLLYRQAAATYRKLSEAQLDPYGLKHPHFPPDSPAGAGQSSGFPVVEFFGDSRAAYWPAPRLAGWRFVNRGIPGQTTEQVRGRFDANVAPVAPRIVVVQAGINDLKAIGLLPYRREQIVADCKANLHEIVSRAADGGAVVIVSTLFPTGTVPLDRKLEWSPEIDRAIEEVNADLRGLASDRVIVFDAWKVLEDHGRLRDGYGLDTLHLSAAGYDGLNAGLARILDGMGDKTH